MRDTKFERNGVHHPGIADLPLLFVTLALLVIGVVMVYSTTGVVSQEKFGDSFYYVKRQVFAALLGLAGMVLVSRISVERIRRVSPYCLVIGLALLVLPLLPSIGDSAGGARRWVNLGAARFQPGELSKLLFVIFIAGFYSRREETLSAFTDGLVKPMVVLAPVALLFLLQPDFGSTAVVTLVTLCMGAAAGVRLRYLLYCGLILLVLGGALVAISPYRMSRVMIFLSPWSDASGKGYQLIQSLIAVATGEVSGVGLGASQQKLFFLPAAHTDFIFAVIAEELGFIGALVLVLLFLVFLWRGFRLASTYADDTFTFCLAVGMTLLIVLPALLNVGVVTGLLPTKGMVLPLVGYGGSSLIASLLCVGLLLSLTREIDRRV